MNDLSGSFTPSKKPQKKIISNNVFETLENAGAATVQKAAEVSSEAVKDMWRQIMGVDTSPKSTPQGEMKPGQEVSFQKKAKEVKSEAPMSYLQEFRDVGKNAMKQEKAEISHQLQGIMYELQRLAHSSKAVEAQVTQAVGTGVIKEGKGTVNFLSMVLATIRIARSRVENAGAWLMQVKKKKGFIQNMKKNMSQYLSGERGISTQNG